MSLKRIGLALASTVFVLVGLFAAFFQIAEAAPYEKLGTRSLNIASSVPGEVTTYTITMSWQSSTSNGSIRFLLCEDYVVDQPCSSTPAGDLSAASLTAQSGALTPYAVQSTAANEILINRGSAGATGTGMYSFTFEDVQNPTGLHHRFYIQIFTYNSTDGTGTPTHMSSIASATAEPIVVSATVPPYLWFCAALTITDWCDSVGGNYVDYGTLDPDNGHYATSQFGVATNAVGGYQVTVNGDTMTSGSRTIEPLAVPAPFTTGIQQFGLNLRANTAPAIGADAVGPGLGVVDADYDVPDQFLFVDGDVVASSLTATTFNTFTVTYILNVNPDLPSGVYNTTIAYICTASF